MQAFVLRQSAWQCTRAWGTAAFPPSQDTRIAAPAGRLGRSQVAARCGPGNSAWRQARAKLSSPGPPEELSGIECCRMSRVGMGRANFLSIFSKAQTEFASLPMCTCAVNSCWPVVTTNEGMRKRGRSCRKATTSQVCYKSRFSPLDFRSPSETEKGPEQYKYGRM